MSQRNPLVLRRSLCLLQNPQCQQLTFSRRASTVQIPPESPRFIDIPRPPQRTAPPPDTIKGILPVPRDLIPTDRKSTIRKRKTSPDFLDKVAREPSAPKQYNSNLSAEHKALVSWKAQQSSLRRQNLRESIPALARRPSRLNRRSALDIDLAARRRLANASEHESDRLTNPSIIAAMKDLTIHAPTPAERAKLLAEKTRNHQEAEARKEIARAQALHTLYLNARSFITDEASLVAKIDEVFDDRWFKAHPEHSIWDKEGFPDTIDDMLKRADQGGNTSTNAVGRRMRGGESGEGGFASLTRERVKRIAGEVTGGKIA